MALDHEPQGRNFWKAIGGLTANVKWLIEAVKRLDQGLKETNDRIERGRTETNDRIERGLQETNRRIDRLLYAVIALIGGVTATLVLQIVGD